MRVIHTSKNGMYRIVEHTDSDFDMENLKGDSYNAEVNHDLDPGILKQEESEFEDLVNREGVFGYELQQWNHDPDCGWEVIDSCWGFVGSYSPNDEKFNHYIVCEMINTHTQTPLNNEGVNMKNTIAWGTKELVNQYNYLSSGRYFDKGTMRFFNSRITENYKRISDTEALFITTERAPHDTVRHATIRRAKLVSYVRESDKRVCEKIEINTVGEFNVLSLAQAKRRLMKEL